MLSIPVQGGISDFRVLAIDSGGDVKKTLSNER